MTAEAFPPSEGKIPGEAASSTSRRSTTRVSAVLKVLSGLILLGVAALSVRHLTGQGLPPQEMVARAHPGLLLLGTLSLLAATFLMAMRWRVLLPAPAGAPPHSPFLFLVLCAGQLLAHVLPGPLAEASQAVFIGRRHRLNTGAVLASALQARVVGLITAGLLALLLWMGLPEGVRQEHGPLLLTTLAATVGASSGLLAFIAFPHLFSRLARRILEGISSWLASRSLPGEGFVARIAGVVVPFAEAIGSAPEGKRGWIRASVLALLCHGAVATSLVLNCHAFGLKPDPWGVAFGYAAVTAASVALFLLPAFELGWDALSAALLAAAGGIHLSEALMVTLMLRMERLAILALGSSLLWGTTGARLSESPPEKRAGEPSTSA